MARQGGNCFTRTFPEEEKYQNQDAPVCHTPPVIYLRHCRANRSSIGHGSDFAQQWGIGAGVWDHPLPALLKTHEFFRFPVSGFFWDDSWRRGKQAIGVHPGPFQSLGGVVWGNK